MSDPTRPDPQDDATLSEMRLETGAGPPLENDAGRPLESDAGLPDYLWNGVGEPDEMVAELESLLAPLRYRGELTDVALAAAYAEAAGDESSEPRAEEHQHHAHDPQEAKPEPLSKVVAALPQTAPANTTSSWAWLAAAAMFALVAGWALRGDPQPLSLHGEAGFRTQQLQDQLGGAVLQLSKGWQVDVVGGVPVCDGVAMATGSQLRVGTWMQTDRHASARLTVPKIGVVEVAQNTRLRIVTSHDQQHRVELSQGSIHASVKAPEEVFVVDTPLGTVVDLGCSYTVTLAAGTLNVDVWSGAIALEPPQNGSRAERVFVPEGASCKATGEAIGTPRFRNANAALVGALARYDNGEREALPDVLEAAQTADALTLWHLYSRQRGAAQQGIATRMSALQMALPSNIAAAEFHRGTVDAGRWWPALRASLSKAVEKAPQPPPPIQPAPTPPVPTPSATAPTPAPPASNDPQVPIWGRQPAPSNGVSTEPAPRAPTRERGRR